MNKQTVHDELQRSRTTFHQLLDGATCYLSALWSG